jgi:hypothetical protein
MTHDSVVAAREFVQSVELPEPPPPRFDAAKGVAKAPAFSFDAATDQATVVGSEVISFVKGVTPEQRNDIVNASLLAQLVAKKRVAEANTLPDVVRWHEEYFDVLSHERAGPDREEAPALHQRLHREPAGPEGRRAGRELDDRGSGVRSWLRPGEATP